MVENMVFISAKAGPPNVGDDKSKFTVQYFDEQGNMNVGRLVRKTLFQNGLFQEYIKKEV